mgnify:CR=1 FL=1
MPVKHRILAIRLSAMGDIIHALPAVASLKHSFPHSHISWIVSRKWAPLLEGNPFLDEVIPFDRTSLKSLFFVQGRLRREKFDFVVDFQGLIQTALIAFVSRTEKVYGFHPSELRERAAGLFYSHQVRTAAAHVVEKNLELAAAVGASNLLRTFPIPAGAAEGVLPEGAFILASPLAGWAAKQWPLEYYGILAGLLKRRHGVTLVFNGPPGAVETLAKVPDVAVHVSGLPGLIHATRQALGVVGVDSGPLHLAAALRKPGVAIFGPTDPARNGPYGETFEVLRAPGAATTYKRNAEVVSSMRAIQPEEVYEALKRSVLSSLSIA